MQPPRRALGEGTAHGLLVAEQRPPGKRHRSERADVPGLRSGDGERRASARVIVEPGTFTSDGPRGAESFKRLRAFAAVHPNVEVRMGHQR